MRLFIAIDFNELKGPLTKLQNNIDKSNIKLKQTSAFHLTLKFLGEADPKPIKEKLKSVSFKPFQISLDKIGVFPDENYIKVIWVGVEPKEPVIKLQDDIEKVLKDFKKDFKFHPHITLARVKFVNNKQKCVENLNSIEVKKDSIEVKDFRLVKSTLTPEGPVYEDIATFSAN